jgi:hypothetical protein
MYKSSVNWQIGGVTYRDISARLDCGVIKSVLIPMYRDSSIKTVSIRTDF